MKFLQIVFFFLLILGADSVFGQDLHIYYDVQTQNIRYERKGNTIDRPKVGRGESVFLHVQNYNNYLYDVEVAANETEIEIPGISGSNFPTDLMGDGSSGIPILNLLTLGGIDLTNNPLFNLFSGEKDDLSGFVKKEDLSALEQIQYKYSNLLSGLQEHEQELKEIGQEIEKEMEAREIKDIVLQEVEKLKYHPQLKPDQIKRMTNEYLQKAFNVKDPSEIDLEYILERNDTRKIMVGHLTDLRKNEEAYKRDVYKLNNLMKDVTLLGFVDPEVKQLTEEVKYTQDHSKAVQKIVAEDAALLEKLINGSKKEDLQKISALRYEYEALISNDFSSTFRTLARGDLLTFDLTFKLKDSTRQAEHPKQLAQIEVPVSGGFKVNASIGISFGQFFKQPKEYAVRDSIILATDRDNFIPSVTSFVNFYSQSSKNVSVGGALGIGFPIGNNTGQSISFFAGPSLIIGKQSSIVISAGLMGGRVDRLAQGYKVGDRYVSDAAIVPTSQRYELGFFAAMSYNLSSK